MTSSQLNMLYESSKIMQEDYKIKKLLKRNKNLKWWEEDDFWHEPQINMKKINFAQLIFEQVTINNL